MKSIKTRDIKLIIKIGQDGHYDHETHQVNKGLPDKSREKYLKRRR
jgi:hypothetical protein